MANKTMTQTAASVSVKQVATLTGMLLTASAAIATIMTVFLVVR
ncbi:MAG: hypothetical protein WCT26_05195 [Candidatus Buchananbacteria bacterium]|jgi:hypothetical protein